MSDCDHIVGLNDEFGDSPNLWTVSDVKSDPHGVDVREWFKFCPLCGAQIDGEIIKDRARVEREQQAEREAAAREEHRRLMAWPL